MTTTPAPTVRLRRSAHVGGHGGNVSSYDVTVDGVKVGWVTCTQTSTSVYLLATRVPGHDLAGRTFPTRKAAVDAITRRVAA